MKPLRLLLLALLLGANASAQDFSIPWFTLGGTLRNSTGGGFSLAANMGRPSAGTQMTGGDFQVSPTTLAVAVVVTSSDAPKLRVQSGPGGIVLAWPNASTGFVLQQCTDLTSPVWIPVEATASVVGDEKLVSLPSEPGRRFFRLHRP